jgi:hypothetical protein
MTTKDSLPEGEAEPVQGTTQAEEQHSEREAGESASPPVVNPHDAEDDEPKPDESYDETDRKQDEAIDSLADQTKWIIEQANSAKEQVRWTKYQTVASSFVSVVTLGVLVLHGWIMWDQSEATRESVTAAKDQVAVMQKQVEMTDRPWLAVDAAPGGPLVFRSLEAGLTVRFTVKNVGRSVANEAVVKAEVFIGKSGEDVYGEAIERQRQICKETTTTITSHTAFPDGTFTVGQLIFTKISAMERGRLPNSHDLPFFFVIGCVDYRFGDQPTRHYTNFIYEVFGTERNHIKVGQDVPADGLTFIKSSNGGDDAD